MAKTSTDNQQTAWNLTDKGPDCPRFSTKPFVKAFLTALFYSFRQLTVWSNIMYVTVKSSRVVYQSQVPSVVNILWERASIYDGCQWGRYKSNTFASVTEIIQIGLSYDLRPNILKL